MCLVGEAAESVGMSAASWVCKREMQVAVSLTKTVSELFLAPERFSFSTDWFSGGGQVEDDNRGRWARGRKQIMLGFLILKVLLLIQTVWKAPLTPLAGTSPRAVIPPNGSRERDPSHWYFEKEYGELQREGRIYPRRVLNVDSKQRSNSDLHFMVNHQSSYGPVTSFL